MSTAPAEVPAYPQQASELKLVLVGRFPQLRVLAWHGDELYASCGYDVVKARCRNSKIVWEQVAHFQPSRWRAVTSRASLTSRLVRDGFHALTVLPSGELIAALPGAIATLAAGENEFQITHRIQRGTRPLHIASTPTGEAFWGEYFDNPNRAEVHIYGSADHGQTWQIAYSFGKRQIRHIHNLVYDKWGDCLWVLTGDAGRECRILRASRDFKTVDVILSGNQQARAAVMLVTEDALYFASDTPFEQNHIYRLDRKGNLESLTKVNSSSIYGCMVGTTIWFSTMAEPSGVNRDGQVHLYGSDSGENWREYMGWQKDLWPMGLFQYGNAFLPNGENKTDVLALSTIAVNRDDQTTTLWRVARP
jgi:hypothetical protein